jgi:hypothetical protein
MIKIELNVSIVYCCILHNMIPNGKGANINELML